MFQPLFLETIRCNPLGIAGSMASSRQHSGGLGAILFSNSTRADMDNIMGWKDGTWNIFTYYYLHFYIIQWDTIYYYT
jgi:hypothetical protein